MVRTQSGLANGQRAGVEQLGFGVLSLHVVDGSQIVQGRGHQRMPGAQAGLHYRGRAPCKCLGFRVTPGTEVEFGQTVQGRRQIRTLRAGCLFDDRQRPTVLRLRTVEVSFDSILFRILEQGDGLARLGVR